MSGIRICIACAIVTLGLASASQAAYTLTDGNSSAGIDVESQAGMYDWYIDGVDQMSQQWFWYRVEGDTREWSIDHIGTPSVSTLGTNFVSATYTQANQFSIRVDYLLRGGLPGSGASDVAETITINNTSNSALGIHFYQYTDFDLAGTPGNDVVQLGKNLQNLFNEALQKDGALNIAETVTGPGANSGEANFYANTLNSLNDTSITNLSGAVGPLGPGDVTWAFQWDLNIPAGGSAIISKDKNLSVPEPSTVGLMALGVLGLGLRRRCRKRI